MERPSAAVVPELHNAREDFYGVALGIFYCAIGISLLHKGGMITGGIAGLALLASFFVQKSVGALVVIFNVPFVAFAFFAMDRDFGAKTLVVSAILGVAISIVNNAVTVIAISSAFSSIGGGTLLGTGILFLARHNASLGGTGVIVLWVQRKFGYNPGLAQLMIDGIIFMVATALLPLQTVSWSLLGTFSMNAMLIVWHKPGRYLG